MSGITAVVSGVGAVLVNPVEGRLVEAEAVVCPKVMRMHGM
jgi:hypothetical protein